MEGRVQVLPTRPVIYGRVICAGPRPVFRPLQGTFYLPCRLIASRV